MTITRIDPSTYAVVTTVVLADGSLRADHCMELKGNSLVSRERRGHIRVGGLMKVTILNETVLQEVRNLPVGSSLTRN